MWRRWVLAGLGAMVAGLLQVNAVALVFTVVVAGYVALLRWRGSWRAAIAVVVAPVGLLGYLGFVASRTGMIDGYMVIQRLGWHSAWDFGARPAHDVWVILLWKQDTFWLVEVIVIAASLVLLGWCVICRLPWPLLLFAGVAVAMAVGTSGIMSTKPRELMVALPLLLPIALCLQHQRRRVVVAAVVLLALGGLWFGPYVLSATGMAI